MRHWHRILLGSTLLATLALAWPGYGIVGAARGRHAAGVCPAVHSESRFSASARRHQGECAAAWEQIRAVLTDEQRATLDAAELGQWQMGGHRAFGGCGAKAGTARGEQPGHWFLDRLAQKLNLTDEQRQRPDNPGSDADGGAGSS